MKNLLSMAISLALAVSIVGAGIYVMWHSTSDITQETIAYKSNESYGTNLGTQATPESVSSGGIVKCESNGKTTYSDKKCQQAEHQVAVNIKETSGGFVSPDQQTIADTRARIRADIQRPGFVAMAGESTPAITNNTQGQCYYLAEEIKSIDSASNIGQSGWSQEQLRLRRLDVRNRMYRLGC